MNALLDADFIIHLRQMGCSQILIDMATKNNWTILLPQKAKLEATRKQSLDPALQAQIGNGFIKEVSCNRLTFDNLKVLHANLGEGELESLSIAYDCLDNRLTSYLILSDDTKARNRAKDYQIPSADTLVFLALANHLGLLPKQKVMDYLKSLAKHSFTPNAARLQLLVESLA